jgi:uncharacterized protein (DUF488 family)
VEDRRVLTIGHSTHDLETFARLLGDAGGEAVADVRRFPSSRRLPHFNRPALEAGLAEREIGYEWLGEELGGRRKPAPGSPNTGWEVAGFRAYADFMQTAEFEDGIERLERLAGERSVAFMCAEGPWWRCHRRLVADAMLVRGCRVEHVMPDGRIQPHALTEFAVADGTRLIYPPAQGSLTG